MDEKSKGIVRAREERLDEIEVAMPLTQTVTSAAKRRNTNNTMNPDQQGQAGASGQVGLRSPLQIQQGQTAPDPSNPRAGSPHLPPTPVQQRSPALESKQASFQRMLTNHETDHGEDVVTSFRSGGEVHSLMTKLIKTIAQQGFIYQKLTLTPFHFINRQK